LNLKQKSKRILDILEHLYPNPPIPLDHRNPFTLLVAVVLSAQCTDKKVNQVTPALFAKGANPAAMAQMDVDDIQETIRTLGLAPQKAKALKALSKRLVTTFNGEVPHTFGELESLAGVGHKTASVVMAQVFGVPSFPVDTHIHRLAARWGLSNGRNVKQTEADLKRVFPKKSWNPLHLRMIYFGREHCPARGHKLGTCPICSWAAQEVG